MSTARFRRVGLLSTADTCLVSRVCHISSFSRHNRLHSLIDMSCAVLTQIHSEARTVLNSYISWAAVSASLSLIVLLAIEKPFIYISGHFEQIKIELKIEIELIRYDMIRNAILTCSQKLP